MKIVIIFIVIILFSSAVSNSQNAIQIAKRLSNPLGYLSIPFQNNIDFNIEPNNGFKWTMNLMPIIPFAINKNWNSLNRIVVPVISQTDIYKNTTQTGISDILINAFLSPRGDGMVWGLGPAINIPSGFPEELTTKKWGLGPNFIAMNSFGRLILGALVFHLWSAAGSDTRPEYSFTYFQPVSLYNFNGGWGIGLSAEMSNEWKKKVSTGAVIFQGSKLINISGQLINFVLGPKYYFGNFKKPEIGIRASVNFLFP
ncbi:MAG: hypothetical protein NTV87_02900 [Ignavibacteriae bacterium]|nr:hypothetical protein [Ignavibacteriota bacterium]